MPKSPYELEQLKEGQLFKLANTAGLEGYNNLFRKRTVNGKVQAMATTGDETGAIQTGYTPQDINAFGSITPFSLSEQGRSGSLLDYQRALEGAGVPRSFNQISSQTLGSGSTSLAAQIRTPSYSPVYPVQTLGDPSGQQIDYTLKPNETTEQYNTRILEARSTAQGGAGTTDGGQLTAPEQKAQTLSERIQDLTKGLYGESAFRANAEGDAGVNNLVRTQRELESQLRNLKNEAAAIPLQLREGAQGRGITTDVLGRQEQSLLRQNAIKALSVNSLLEASRGNLSLAYDMVDRAVASTYNPIKEEIMATKGNLDLILSSPDYKAADKKRATEQKAIQDEREREVDQAASDQKHIYTIAVGAARNGASSSVLQDIFSSSTPQQALKIAAQNGIVSTKKVGGGGGGQLSDIAQAIIDNPSLFNDLTPTKRGEIIPELQRGGYDTSNLGTKSLSDTAIERISQTQKALSDISELRKIIQGNEEYLGPVSGFARYNPYNKARQIQADVDRVKQTVGKALEGGVLRKEDEDKYKKILATLSDTPETATYKIDALIGSIQRDVETYKSLQESGGRSIDTKAPLTLKGSTTSLEQLRNKYKY